MSVFSIFALTCEEKNYKIKFTFYLTKPQSNCVVKSFKITKNTQHETRY